MCPIIIICSAVSAAADDADDEDQAAAEGSDVSDDEEEAMEVDSRAAPSDTPMETDTPNEAKDVVSKRATTATAALKPTAVASGLPQSKEELENLISIIHTTVNNSVLPRLNKCLNAKVTSMTWPVLIRGGEKS